MSFRPSPADVAAMNAEICGTSCRLAVQAFTSVSSKLPRRTAIHDVIFYVACSDEQPLRLPPHELSGHSPRCRGPMLIVEMSDATAGGKLNPARFWGLAVSGPFTGAQRATIYDLHDKYLVGTGGP